MQAIKGLGNFIVSIQLSSRGTMTMFQSPALYQPPAVSVQFMNPHTFMKVIMLILNILIVTFLISCSNNRVEEKIPITRLSKLNQDEKDTVKYVHSLFENELALMIGERIEFLNDSLKSLKVSIFDNGNIVKILNYSDSLVYDSLNPCNSYKYVEIQTKDTIGWVDSRNVFRIIKSKENIIKIFDNNNCKLYRSSNFNINWFLEEESDLLNDCNHYYPIVLEIDSLKYLGPIKLVRNHLLEGESWLKDFSFFELVGSNDMYDEIISVTKSEYGTYLMQIKRNLHEASYDIDVILKKENEYWTAEYVRFGKWEAYYKEEQKFYDKHNEKKL